VRVCAVTEFRSGLDRVSYGGGVREIVSLGRSPFFFSGSRGRVADLEREGFFGVIPGDLVFFEILSSNGAHRIALERFKPRG